MAFRVCVLSDSISPTDVRLVTFGVEEPREILAEVNTHTIVSKNASSSRAIPVERMLDKIQSDPYIPEFGRNQKGMQAAENLTGDNADAARRCWLRSMKLAVDHAREMAGYEAHKQVANRIVENYGWTRQVLTATHWANFFALRTHEDAHPAFRKLARLMYVAMQRSTPKRLDYHQWHLPLVVDADRGKAEWLARNGFQWEPDALPLKMSFSHRFGPTALADLFLCIMSAARCARVSYNRIEDRTSAEFNAGDWQTFRRLAIRAEDADSPVHASPTSHQATPMHKAWRTNNPELVSNLQDWIQLRKVIPREVVHKFNPAPEVVAGWGVDESCIVSDPSQF